MTPHQWNVFKTVLEERKAQDAQWGGAEHDDRHTTFAWFDFIGRQLEKVGHGILKQGNEALYLGSPDAKQRLVKIAALALAGLEAMERKEEAVKPVPAPRYVFSFDEEAFYGNAPSREESLKAAVVEAEKRKLRDWPRLRIWIGVITPVRGADLVGGESQLIVEQAKCTLDDMIGEGSEGELEYKADELEAFDAILGPIVEEFLSSNLDCNQVIDAEEVPAEQVKAMVGTIQSFQPRPATREDIKAGAVLVKKSIRHECYEVNEVEETSFTTIIMERPCRIRFDELDNFMLVKAAPTPASGGKGGGN